MEQAITITNEQAKIIGRACGEAIWSGFEEWASRNNPNRMSMLPLQAIVHQFANSLGKALREAHQPRE